MRLFSTSRVKLCGLCAMLVCTFSVSSAHAWQLYSLTTGVGTTAAVAVVVIYVLNDDDDETNESEEKANAEFGYFLAQNREEVLESFYFNDAEHEGVQDLAQMFGVADEHIDVFAQLLVDERESLAPLLVDDVNIEQARRFGRHLTRAMQAHPVLSEDVERAVEDYERRSGQVLARN